jgi:hypothetical protein
MLLILLTPHCCLHCTYSRQQMIQQEHTVCGMEGAAMHTYTVRECIEEDQMNQVTALAAADIDHPRCSCSCVSAAVVLRLLQLLAKARAIGRVALMPYIILPSSPAHLQTVC